MLVLLLIGCQAPAPMPDVAERAAALVDAPGAIKFLAEGEPIDLPAIGSDPLTLEQAARYALVHDPALQAGLARVRAALADAGQARLLPNPVLSLSLRIPEQGGRTTIEASLAADLLNLLNRPRRITAADKRVQATAADALALALDRLAELRESYAAAQAADAELEVLSQQQELVMRLVELAEARVEAGESAQLEMLALQAERVRIEADILEARTQRQDRRLVLARLLGRPSGDVGWQLEAWRPIAPASTDEAAWLAAALEHRPEIQAQRWTLAALGDEAALQRWWPFEGAQAGIDAERDDDWSIGPAVSAPLPLFDGGQAARDKRQAECIEARHQLVAAQRQVVTEVRRALAELNGSQQVLAKVQDELVPLLEQRHERAHAAWQAGASGIVDVLQAEQELLTARARLVKLQSQATIAESRLHRAAGGSPLATPTGAAHHPAESVQSHPRSEVIP